jgi:hypothetical protein
MKREKDRIVRTEQDRQCNTCANSFRTCPMEMVLAFDRVPTGMEIAVLNCPEYRAAES